MSFRMGRAFRCATTRTQRKRVTNVVVLPCAMEGAKSTIDISAALLFNAATIAPNSVTLKGIMLEITHPAPWGSSIVQIRGYAVRDAVPYRTPLHIATTLFHGRTEKIFIKSDAIRKYVHMGGRVVPGSASEEILFDITWTWLNMSAAPATDHEHLKTRGMQNTATLSIWYDPDPGFSELVVVQHKE